MVEPFSRYAVLWHPILLLLDGHSTHYQPGVISFARGHNIIMLCLHPHNSHVSQLLDCGVFKSLKNKWTETCHRYCQMCSGKVNTQFDFNMLFSQAWLKSQIVAGLETCDVFPSSAILVPLDKPCNENKKRNSI